MTTLLERTDGVFAIELDDLNHVVCHCTADSTAWCGVDVTDSPWVDEGDEPCPLCALAEEDRMCPWGCDCAECAGWYEEPA